MYGKIIVGYDGSPQADDALALGKLLAGTTGASLTGVTVAVHRMNPGHKNLWIAFTSSASTM